MKKKTLCSGTRFVHTYVNARGRTTKKIIINRHLAFVERTHSRGVFQLCSRIDRNSHDGSSRVLSPGVPVHRSSHGVHEADGPLFTRPVRGRRRQLNAYSRPGDHRTSQRDFFVCPHTRPDDENKCTDFFTLPSKKVNEYTRHVRTVRSRLATEKNHYHNIRILLARLFPHNYFRVFFTSTLRRNSPPSSRSTTGPLESFVVFKTSSAELCEKKKQSLGAQIRTVRRISVVSMEVRKRSSLFALCAGRYFRLSTIMENW